MMLATTKLMQHRPNANAQIHNDMLLHHLLSMLVLI